MAVAEPAPERHRHGLSELSRGIMDKLRTTLSYVIRKTSK
jgi:hypothetical protein